MIEVLIYCEAVDPDHRLCEDNAVVTFAGDVRLANEGIMLGGLVEWPEGWTVELERGAPPDSMPRTRPEGRGARVIRAGRFTIDPNARQLPRLYVSAADEGDGFRFAAVSLGTRSSDPVLSFELDLGGRRIGRLLEPIYARLDRCSALSLFGVPVGAVPSASGEDR